MKNHVLKLAPIMFLTSVFLVSCPTRTMEENTMSIIQETNVSLKNSKILTARVASIPWDFFLARE